MASRSKSRSPVKSWMTSGWSSTVIRTASSLSLRITLNRKSMAASCSNCRRSRMLLEVSSSRPTRSGRSVCWLKKRISCGLPSSKTLKFSWPRSETILFLRSTTVNSTSTRLTSVRIDWARRLARAPAGVAGAAGGAGRLRPQAGRGKSKRQKKSGNRSENALLEIIGSRAERRQPAAAANSTASASCAR